MGFKLVSSPGQIATQFTPFNYPARADIRMSACPACGTIKPDNEFCQTCSGEHFHPFKIEPTVPYQPFTITYTDQQLANGSVTITPNAVTNSTTVQINSC